MAYRSHRPKVAVAVSLVAGVEIIIVSFIIAILGANLTEATAGGIGAIFGIIGMVWGVLIIVCAYLMYSRAEKHVLWGVFIIVFSVVSIFGALGGIFLGLILGVIGGILGILWGTDKNSIDTNSSAEMDTK